MGVYDTLATRCPACNCENETQSKAADVPMLENYTLADCPLAILSDLANESICCDGCEVVYTVVVNWSSSVIQKGNTSLPRTTYDSSD